MSLSVLRYNERHIAAGMNGFTLVTGMAQFSTTDLTGELPCRFGMVESLFLQPIGPIATASRLHSWTLPTIGATASQNLIAPSAGTITAMSLTVTTTVAVDGTDYWTFTAINKGAAGAGTTALLATSDANTTKTSTGAAITEFTKRALTLHGTAANLVLAAGDVISFVATDASGSAADLVEPVVAITLSTGESDEALYCDELAQVTGGFVHRPSSGFLTINRYSLNPTSGLIFAFQYMGR